MKVHPLTRQAKARVAEPVAPIGWGLWEPQAAPHPTEQREGGEAAQSMGPAVGKLRRPQSWGVTRTGRGWQSQGFKRGRGSAAEGQNT